MTNGVLLAFLIGVALSLITVIGDFFIKHSSLQQSFNGWRYLILGAVIYALTALGWFFVMRKIKLFTAGAVYAISCVILLTLISIFYFKEKATALEILGVSLAIVSLVLLFRFN